MSSVPGHNLVTYGQTDAGAAVFGTSFIELFLYVGKFIVRDPASVVTHGDLYVFSGEFSAYIHIFTVFAVCGSIVQYVQEDLFQTFRIAGDLGDVIIRIR